MKAPFPKTLVYAPIINTTVELKFDINVPIDAVFGLVYSKIHGIYPEIDYLPVTQLPEQIRINDGLDSEPHYRFYKKNSPYSVLLGPKIAIFSYNKKEGNINYEYPGWTGVMDQKVKELFSLIYSTEIITNINRLGIRVSDFFDSINIFEHVEFNLTSTDGSNLKDVKTQIQQIMYDDDYTHNIVISNNAGYSDLDGDKIGSVIDIDTFVSLDLNNIEELYSCLDRCHELNKNNFFNMLKEEFIDTLRDKGGI